MMKIARQVNRDLLIAKDLILEEREVVFGIILVVFSVNLCVDPVRLCRAKNDSISIIHSLCDALEVPHLGDVDV